MLCIMAAKVSKPVLLVANGHLRFPAKASSPPTSLAALLALSTLKGSRKRALELSLLS